ncbi:MAG: ABC transporter ATP-binding protein, partial [Deltaproteobacteria bacterium HGW-Deltaproteobacteria-20]
MSASTAAVSLRGITKVFGAVRANNDISLDIHAGRIKALLGENGAGKSTLMSILAGHYLPDNGQILIDGHESALRSTKDAIRAGIGMVYQHFMLVEAMTVAENVFLGQEPGFFLSPREMREQVRALAKSFGLDIDPAARVADLSMGEKQRVEILKLLQRQSRILIFDEPTAVLTPQEAQQLFTALRSMAAQGKAIVYISHKLGEVMALADEI